VQEHMKLGNRTTLALEILEHHKQITKLIEALGHLDITTRFSAKCGARLVALSGVEIIVDLMRNCNRSKPHQELLKHAVHVLENVSLSPYTMSSLYRADTTLEVLLDLMQNFRDIPGIFHKCTGIMIKICKSKDGSARVAGVTDVNKRLKGMISILKRKIEMETKHSKMTGKKSPALKELSTGYEMVKCVLAKVEARGKDEAGMMGSTCVIRSGICSKAA
jgi:abnormal spindle-like microcephaly-associated protein